MHLPFSTKTKKLPKCTDPTKAKPLDRTRLKRSTQQKLDSRKAVSNLHKNVPNHGATMEKESKFNAMQIVIILIICIVTCITVLANVNIGHHIQFENRFLKWGHVQNNGLNMTFNHLSNFDTNQKVVKMDQHLIRTDILDSSSYGKSSITRTPCSSTCPEKKVKCFDSSRCLMATVAVDEKGEKITAATAEEAVRSDLYLVL
tara:strand:- start:266 stop:871 length:606 start_codon:yes stop_codon:yes gene_type:complete